jgi:hypothetical protein
MRVFLDTEFTNFTDPQLISCGLVAENGNEFYAEMSNGWQTEKCSDFVVTAVLPLLNQSRYASFTRLQAGKNLNDWLASLGSSIALIYDAEIDWQLIADLLQSHQSITSCLISPTLLSWPGSAMARHYELLLEETLAGDAVRHHALVDARALRWAVLETEAEFMK